MRTTRRWRGMGRRMCGMGLSLLAAATLAGFGAAGCDRAAGSDSAAGDSALAASGELAATPGAWIKPTLGGMNAWLYVPTSAAASADGRALMVNLHGCAQSPDALQADGNWLAAAEELGMVVVIPEAPDGGVLAGCWDYYGVDHTRSNRHNDNLLALVDALLTEQGLHIDPDQVYLSGLSSGASQAMVLGCLAPDVFAGVGINAGPTVGTERAQFGSVATSLSAARALCEKWAGAQKSYFATQVASVIYGDNDFTVAQGYNTLNAQVMAGIYGAGQEFPFATSELPGANSVGTGQLYADAAGPRVSVIRNHGLGHNWPAGQGGYGGAFVNKNSVDYPLYLARWFFENNRRKAEEGLPPTEEPPIEEPPIEEPPIEEPPIQEPPIQEPPIQEPRGEQPPVEEPSVVEESSAVDMVISTLTEHIHAGRLGWDSYAKYYLEYGSAAFALYLQGDGTWSDVNPSDSLPAEEPPVEQPPIEEPPVEEPPVEEPPAEEPPAEEPPAEEPPVEEPPASAYPCTEHNTSNYNHVQAGRAHVCQKWYACANGSNQKMGLNNTFYHSMLREVAPGEFEVGACPK